jgi:hypothetical protein
MEDLDYQLTRELEGRLETLMNGLSRGAPADYAEYRTMVGEFRGVRYALDALTKLRQQVSAEDEG